MAVAIDASSPAGVTGTSTAAITTASFTPPAGALLVAATSTGNAGGSGVQGGTLSDSLSGGWTTIASNNLSGSGAAVLSWRQIASSAAMTVTWTPSGTNGKGSLLKVWVITGAPPGASAFPTEITSPHGTTGNASITPVKTGSLLLLSLTYTVASVALTVSGTTTSDQAVADSTNGETYAAAHATALTTAGVAVSVGYSNTGLSAQLGIALAEVAAAVIPKIPPQPGMSRAVAIASFR